MNNHELSGTPEELQTKTEWDKLGEEVEFSESSEKSSESLDFVEENYGDKIDALVFNACFDGGDKTNPDHYVNSMLLDEALTNEEQIQMIDGLARTQKVDRVYSEKIKDFISEKMEHAPSKFLGELRDDPFMRKRHADAISGRIGGDLKENERILYELFTYADEDFYESEEARNLLGDEDYLTNKYRSVFNQLEEKIQKGEAKVDRNELLNNLTSALNSIADKNLATVEELIHDPYLRGKHFDVLAAADLEGAVVSKEFYDLWDVDSEFFDSYEYDSRLRQRAYENPDIYEKRGVEDIDEVINEALEKISMRDFEEVLNAYEKDLRKGDELLFTKLLPILGLDKNPPKFEYGKSDGGESGCYIRHKHRMVVCEELIRDKIVKAGGAPDTERKMLFGLIKRREVGAEAFEHMNVVAHELWHAHQWAGEGVSEERRKKYQENFVYYMKGRNGYDAYRAQLIEREAWAFGGRVEAIARFVRKEGELR
jgi:hypothetical protein